MVVVVVVVSPIFSSVECTHALVAELLYEMHCCNDADSFSFLASATHDTAIRKQYHVTRDRIAGGQIFFQENLV